MSRERRARGNLLLLTSYALVGTCGALVFVAVPSSSLVRQGGYLVAYIWGVFCLACGLSCIAGLLLRRRVLEVVGIALGISAVVTWVAALVLQAVKTGSALPLTAACMVAGLAGLLAHRLSVVVGRPREAVASEQRPRARRGWAWRR